MAKLTLSIEPDRIAKAKRYAYKHQTSISKIVSDFLADITKKDEVEDEDPFIKKLRQIEVSDKIKALSGILKGKVPDDINLWDAKYEYLKEKHEL
jgi:hypothetical protein